MGIAKYFSQNIRKRVPSRLQRKKRQEPKSVTYQPNVKNQISLDSAIKQHSEAKQNKSFRARAGRAYAGYKKSRRKR